MANFCEPGPILTITLLIINCHGEPPRLVVLAFDGFRHDYLSPETTPTLHNLAAAGVLAENMRSTYITKTFPNFLSIATGYYQETHGIVNTVIFDPSFNETFTKSISDSKWWDNGISIPIWLANELSGSNRHSYSSMYPGAYFTFRGRQPAYVENYRVGVPWTERMDRIVHHLARTVKRVNLVMAYFDQPDMTAHRLGPFSQEVETRIQEIDNIIQYFINKLIYKEIYNGTNIVVLSDHGMAATTADRVIDLTEITDTSTYKIFGVSPVYNILPNPGYEEKLYQQLKFASKTHNFKVYKKADIPDEYHYKNNRRVLPILVEADEGFEICVIDPLKVSEKSDADCPSQAMGTWGNHGYNNSFKSMQPMFIAKGPQFKSGYKHKEVFDNVNLFPLMCKVLGLDIAEFPSNGTIETLSQMLLVP